MVTKLYGEKMTDHAIESKNDSILFASRASQLIKDQQVEEALNLCETGVRQFPFYSPGHYILGLCYEAMGKNEDAKNEFERTLVYDPSHNKAMRKLSEFYQNSGLDQLANELLLMEALYSPLNPEIISILKEKNLYEKLNPQQDSAQMTLDQDNTTEIELEKEEHVEDSAIESIEEVIEPEIESIEQVDEDVDETVDEPAAIDNLDPLAKEPVNETDEEDEFDNDNSDSVDEPDVISANREDREEEDDFSPLMKGYLEQDDIDSDDDEWMEVENLLNGEQDEAKTDLDPVPDKPKDETEMLLEQLSSDDDIDLEAAVADPYDQIDLTSEPDRKNVSIDDLDKADLQAAVQDPYEKSADDSENLKKEPVEENAIEEDEGESISDIVSEFESEKSVANETSDTIDADRDVRDEEDEELPEIITQDEDDLVVDEKEEPESIAPEEKPSEPAVQSMKSIQEEEEVSINDMLENPNLVTPTFGEILIAQHKFSEARHVFVELSKKEPENTRFIKKIDFLDKFLQAKGTV